MLRRFALAMVTMIAVLAACQGTPALTSPTEIITQGLEATSKLNSFHMSLAVDGSFSMPEAGGGTVKLDGTTLEADIDIQGRNVHLTFAIPALLGLAGELLVIGPDLYFKSSLTGDKWTHQAADVTGSASPAPSLDPASIVDDVGDFLLKDGVVTTKLADVACGDRQCYQVNVTIPPDLMDDAGAVASLDPSSIFGEALVLNLLFDRDQGWLTAVSTDVASDEIGTFSATLTFSNFDEALDLTPPPSPEVTEGEVTLPFD